MHTLTARQEFRGRRIGARREARIVRRTLTPINSMVPFDSPPLDGMVLPTPSSDQRILDLRQALADAGITPPEHDLRLTAAEIQPEPSNEPSSESLPAADETLPPPVARSKEDELLLWLVRLRFLSSDQIQQLLYRGLHPSLVSRALKRLQERRDIVIWDEPRGRGGRRRYGVPTATGTRRALSMIMHAYPDRTGQLIDAMLPDHGRRPLTLPSGVVPPFLMHQRECNDVAIDLARDPATVWVSTWDRPFRPSIGGVSMPQPDFVLVRTTAASPALIFGEHDRGQESRAHFERAKIRRYVELARLPQFCEDVCGFRSFRVVVTVAGMSDDRCARRVAELETWIANAGATGLLRVTRAEGTHASMRTLLTS